MLIIRRKCGEIVTVGTARILVREIGSGHVELLIDAPLEVFVRRGEPRVCVDTDGAEERTLDGAGAG